MMMLRRSDQWRWKRPRSVTEPTESERRGIDDGRFACDDLGHQPAGAWPDAKPVSRETGRDEEPWQRIDAGNHRYAIGRHIDHAAPGFGDLHLAERRKRCCQIGARLVQDRLIGFWVQRAHALER